MDGIDVIKWLGGLIVGVTAVFWVCMAAAHYVHAQNDEAAHNFGVGYSHSVQQGGGASQVDILRVINDAP